MRRRKEPLLGDSPKGDAGIVYRTLVRLTRGMPPIESKQVFEAATKSSLVSPPGTIAIQAQDIVKGSNSIPEIHLRLHALFGDPETSGGYTLPRISSIPCTRVKEYSPEAYQNLKRIIPTKNGVFLLVLAKSRSGSWKLIV